MKRISIAIIIVLVMALTACKPSGMSQDTYDTGKQALEIIEQYNDGKISGDDAIDRIDRLIDHLEAENTDDDFYKDHHNTMVRLKIDSFSFHVEHGGDTYEDEKELKEELGE